MRKSRFLDDAINHYLAGKIGNLKLVAARLDVEAIKLNGPAPLELAARRSMCVEDGSVRN